MTYRIPFNKPFMVGNELYYIAQSVLSGHTAGDGIFSKKCESLLEDHIAALRVFLTTSCTSSLEMAAVLCNIEPGDEVVLPSYTYVSTANAFVLRGARPVFVDIRPDTLNLDEKLLPKVITDRTKAIVPVHYAGVGCQMDTISEIATEHELSVIEDAAQGVNAKFKGDYLGTLGDLGCFSFHETKNFICGEGGALVVTDDKLVERAEIIREKGTNRSKFFRGQVDKYTWIDVGSSYLPSDILAAFLFAQLENMERITKKRKWIYELYNVLLKPLAERELLVLPTIPEECESNYHMLHVLLKDNKVRMDLINHLKSKGILAVFHYIPLHTSPMGQKLGYREESLPVTKDISERVLRLPFYYEMKEADIREVVQEIFAFFSLRFNG